MLAALEKEVASYDLDEYLPESTIALYGKLLEDGGYPREFTYGDSRHREAYLYLREKVSRYIASDGVVQLASRPSGAAKWISTNRMHEIEAHRGNIIGISGDTTMQLVPTDDEEEEEELAAMENFIPEANADSIPYQEMLTTSDSSNIDNPSGSFNSNRK